jgi:hypothetical protein
MAGSGPAMTVRNDSIRAGRDADAAGFIALIGDC